MDRASGGLKFDRSEDLALLGDLSGGELKDAARVSDRGVGPSRCVSIRVRSRERTIVVGLLIGLSYDSFNPRSLSRAND